MASPLTLSTPDEGPVSLPELSEYEFLSQVLRLSPDKTEAQADNELVVKANAAGIAASLPTVANRRHIPSAISSPALLNCPDHTFSTTSEASASSALTPHSSVYYPSSPLIGLSEPGFAMDPDSLTFSQYEKYLAFLESSVLPASPCTPPASDIAAQSLFSVSTKKSFSSVKTGFKNRIRWRKRSAQPLDSTLSCAKCRDASTTSTLHTLPCGHTHCAGCVRALVNQAVAQESKMPPRCCAKIVPSSTLESVLDPRAQETFLLAVLQFSTPWETRKFCPRSSCGAFLPPQKQVDSKHPFDLTCRKCSSRMCVMCQEAAHSLGGDCPQDWELKAVSNMGERSKWKRCYNCRNLVERTKAGPYMACRCKARFCSTCTAIWDTATGCPNDCNPEAEQNMLGQGSDGVEVATASSNSEETCKRTRSNSAMQQLEKEQEQEMRRFLDFQSQANCAMQLRHSAHKVTIMEKFTDLEDKLKEKHAKSTSELEDRQIAAELELRNSLDQSERSVRLRLKHMEAYCDGLGRHPVSPAPTRVVTERDLRELGQQYNLRDGMDRMHQAKINVMRDRQTKRMEELLDRQDAELDKLYDQRQVELDNVSAQFSREEAMATAFFEARQSRIHPRWVLAIEVLSKQLEERSGQEVVRVAPPRWPEVAIEPEEKSSSGLEIHDNDFVAAVDSN